MLTTSQPTLYTQGLTTIRAHRKQQRFVQHTYALMDNSARAWWPCQCVNRWLSVRLELVGLTVVFGSALFVSVVQRRSAGLAGLAITSALNLTGLMNWCDGSRFRHVHDVPSGWCGRSVSWKWT